MKARAEVAATTTATTPMMAASTSIAADAVLSFGLSFFFSFTQELSRFLSGEDAVKLLCVATAVFNLTADVALFLALKSFLFFSSRSLLSPSLLEKEGGKKALLLRIKTQQVRAIINHQNLVAKLALAPLFLSAHLFVASAESVVGTLTMKRPTPRHVRSIYVRTQYSRNSK